MQHWFKKSVSIWVIVLFTVNTCFADAGLSIDLSPRAETPKFLQIDIPAELASVEDFYEAPARPSPKMILHIQNAHTNYEAQQKIRDLMAHLNKNYGFKTIFVEGASENLNPEYLKLFPDAETNRKLWDELAKRGQITGADWFLLENASADTTDAVEDLKLRRLGKEAKGVGIEKAELYRKNYEALKAVYGREAETNRFLGGLESELDKLASKILPPQKRSILSEWKKFEKGHREFIPFVANLAKLSKENLNLDLHGLMSQIEWPQLTRLLVLQQMEKKLAASVDVSREAHLDKDKSLHASRFTGSAREAAEVERQQMIAWLKANGIRKELIQKLELFDEQHINLNTITASSGKTESLPRFFIEKLIEEAGPKGLKFSDYPNFALQAGYLILRYEIEPNSLFSEIRSLFDKLLEATVSRETHLDKASHISQSAARDIGVSRTTNDEPREKVLIELFRDAELMRKLLNLELSREEWIQTLSKRKDLEPKKIFERVKNIGREESTVKREAAVQRDTFHEIRDTKSDYQREVIIAFHNAFSFYDFATQREEVFFQKIETELAHTDKAILMTGGFHTDGLKTLFRDHDISYGTLTPRLTQVENSNLYREVMLGRSSAREAPLASGISSNSSRNTLHDMRDTGSPNNTAEIVSPLLSFKARFESGETGEVIESRMAPAVEAVTKDRSEAREIIQRFLRAIGLPGEKKSDSASNQDFGKLNIERIKATSVDPNFINAVNYFNDVVVIAPAITEEHLVTLFEQYRGFPKDPKIHARRVSSLMKLRSSGEFKKVIDLINSQPQQAEIVESASKIFVDFLYGHFMWGQDGFNDSGETDEHSASGHHRLSWFLMNYFLIHNQYTPFYFKNLAEYDDTHGMVSFKLPILVRERVLPVTRSESRVPDIATGTETEAAVLAKLDALIKAKRTDKATDDELLPAIKQLENETTKVSSISNPLFYEKIFELMSLWPVYNQGKRVHEELDKILYLQTINAGADSVREGLFRFLKGKNAANSLAPISIVISGLLGARSDEGPYSQASNFSFISKRAADQLLQQLEAFKLDPETGLLLGSVLLAQAEMSTYTHIMNRLVEMYGASTEAQMKRDAYNPIPSNPEELHREFRKSILFVLFYRQTHDKFKEIYDKNFLAELSALIRMVSTEAVPTVDSTFDYNPKFIPKIKNLGSLMVVMNHEFTHGKYGSHVVVDASEETRGNATHDMAVEEFLSDIGGGALSELLELNPSDWYEFIKESSTLHLVAGQDVKTAREQHAMARRTIGEYIAAWQQSPAGQAGKHFPAVEVLDLAETVFYKKENSTFLKFEAFIRKLNQKILKSGISFIVRSESHNSSDRLLAISGQSEPLAAGVLRSEINIDESKSLLEQAAVILRDRTGETARAEIQELINRIPAQHLDILYSNTYFDFYTDSIYNSDFIQNHAASLNQQDPDYTYYQAVAKAISLTQKKFMSDKVKRKAYYQTILMKFAPEAARMWDGGINNAYDEPRYVSRSLEELDDTYQISRELDASRGERKKVLIVGVGYGFAAVEMAIKYSNINITALNKERELWHPAWVKHNLLARYSERQIDEALTRISPVAIDVENEVQLEPSFDMILFEKETQIYMKDKVHTIERFFNQHLALDGVFAFSAQLIRMKNNNEAVGGSLNREPAPEAAGIIEKSFGDAGANEARLPGSGKSFMKYRKQTTKVLDVPLKELRTELFEKDGPVHGPQIYVSFYSKVSDEVSDSSSSETRTDSDPLPSVSGKPEARTPTTEGKSKGGASFLERLAGRLPEESKFYRLWAVNELLIAAYFFYLIPVIWMISSGSASPGFIELAGHITREGLTPLLFIHLLFLFFEKLIKRETGIVFWTYAQAVLVVTLSLIGQIRSARFFVTLRAASDAIAGLSESGEDLKERRLFSVLDAVMSIFGMLTGFSGLISWLFLKFSGWSGEPFSNLQLFTSLMLHVSGLFFSLAGAANLIYLFKYKILKSQKHLEIIPEASTPVSEPNDARSESREMKIPLNTAVFDAIKAKNENYLSRIRNLNQIWFNLGQDGSLQGAFKTADFNEGVDLALQAIESHPEHLERHYRRVDFKFSSETVLVVLGGVAIFFVVHPGLFVAAALSFGMFAFYERFDSQLRDIRRQLKDSQELYKLIKDNREMIILLAGSVQTGPRSEMREIISEQDFENWDEAKHRIFVFHKPRGMETGSAEFKSLVSEQLRASGATQPENFFNAFGRLDKDSEGLILVGKGPRNFSNVLLNPLWAGDQKILKTYVAIVSGKVSALDLNLLRAGVPLSGQVFKAINVTSELLEGAQNVQPFSKVTISIGEGIYHQVRQMLFAAGKHRMQKLTRINFDGIPLDGLEAGKIRELNPVEYQKMKATYQSVRGRMIGKPFPARDKGPFRSEMRLTNQEDGLAAANQLWSRLKDWPAQSGLSKKKLGQYVLALQALYEGKQKTLEDMKNMQASIFIDVVMQNQILNLKTTMSEMGLAVFREYLQFMKWVYLVIHAKSEGRNGGIDDMDDPEMALEYIRIEDMLEKGSETPVRTIINRLPAIFMERHPNENEKSEVSHALDKNQIRVTEYKTGGWGVNFLDYSSRPGKSLVLGFNVNGDKKFGFITSPNEKNQVPRETELAADPLEDIQFIADDQALVLTFSANDYEKIIKLIGSASFQIGSFKLQIVSRSEIRKTKNAATAGSSAAELKWPNSLIFELEPGSQERELTLARFLEKQGFHDLQSILKRFKTPKGVPRNVEPKLFLELTFDDTIRSNIDLRAILKNNPSATLRALDEHIKRMEKKGILREHGARIKRGFPKLTRVRQVVVRLQKPDGLIFAVKKIPRASDGPKPKILSVKDGEAVMPGFNRGKLTKKLNQALAPLFPVPFPGRVDRKRKDFIQLVINRLITEPDEPNLKNVEVLYCVLSPEVLEKIIFGARDTQEAQAFFLSRKIAENNAVGLPLEFSIAALVSEEIKFEIGWPVDFLKLETKMPVPLHALTEQSKRTLYEKLEGRDDKKLAQALGYGGDVEQMQRELGSQLQKRSENRSIKKYLVPGLAVVGAIGIIAVMAGVAAIFAVPTAGFYLVAFAGMMMGAFGLRIAGINYVDRIRDESGAGAPSSLAQLMLAEFAAGLTAFRSESRNNMIHEPRATKSETRAAAVRSEMRTSPNKGWASQRLELKDGDRISFDQLPSTGRLGRARKAIEFLEANGFKNFMIIGSSVRRLFSEEVDEEDPGEVTGEVDVVLEDELEFKRLQQLGNAKSFRELILANDLEFDVVATKDKRDPKKLKRFNYATLESMPSFSLNMIGINSDGTIHDPHQGIEDIKNKKLRWVNPAPNRPLQVMDVTRYIGFEFYYSNKGFQRSDSMDDGGDQQIRVALNFGKIGKNPETQAIYRVYRLAKWMDARLKDLEEKQRAGKSIRLGRLMLMLRILMWTRLEIIQDLFKAIVIFDWASVGRELSDLMDIKSLIDARARAFYAKSLLGRFDSRGIRERALDNRYGLKAELKFPGDPYREFEGMSLARLGKELGYLVYYAPDPVAALTKLKEMGGDWLLDIFNMPVEQIAELTLARHRKTVSATRSEMRGSSFFKIFLASAIMGAQGLFGSVAENTETKSRVQTILQEARSTTREKNIQLALAEEAKQKALQGKLERFDQAEARVILDKLVNQIIPEASAEQRESLVRLGLLTLVVESDSFRVFIQRVSVFDPVTKKNKLEPRLIAVGNGQIEVGALTSLVGPEHIRSLLRFKNIEGRTDLLELVRQRLRDQVAAELEMTSGELSELSAAFKREASDSKLTASQIERNANALLGKWLGVKIISDRETDLTFMLMRYLRVYASKAMNEKNAGLYPDLNSAFLAQFPDLVSGTDAAIQVRATRFYGLDYRSKFSTDFNAQVKIDSHNARKMASALPTVTPFFAQVKSTPELHSPVMTPLVTVKPFNSFIDIIRSPLILLPTLIVGLLAAFKILKPFGLRGQVSPGQSVLNWTTLSWAVGAWIHTLLSFIAVSRGLADSAGIMTPLGLSAIPSLIFLGAIGYQNRNKLSNLFGRKNDTETGGRSEMREATDLLDEKTAADLIALVKSGKRFKDFLAKAEIPNLKRVGDTFRVGQAMYVLSPTKIEVRPAGEVHWRSLSLSHFEVKETAAELILNEISMDNEFGFVGQGIGSTLMAYMALYAAVTGKALRIPSTDNYWLAYSALKYWGQSATYRSKTGEAESLRGQYVSPPSVIIFEIHDPVRERIFFRWKPSSREYEARVEGGSEESVYAKVLRLNWEVNETDGLPKLVMQSAEPRVVVPQAASYYFLQAISNISIQANELLPEYANYVRGRSEMRLGAWFVIMTRMAEAQKRFLNSAFSILMNPRISPANKKIRLAALFQRMRNKGLLSGAARPEVWVRKTEALIESARGDLESGATDIFKVDRFPAANAEIRKAVRFYLQAIQSRLESVQKNGTEMQKKNVHLAAWQLAAILRGWSYLKNQIRTKRRKGLHFSEVEKPRGLERRVEGIFRLSPNGNKRYQLRVKFIWEWGGREGVKPNGSIVFDIAPEGIDLDKARQPSVARRALPGLGVADFRIDLHPIKGRDAVAHANPPIAVKWRGANWHQPISSLTRAERFKQFMDALVEQLGKRSEMRGVNEQKTAELERKIDEFANALTEQTGQSAESQQWDDHETQFHELIKLKQEINPEAILYGEHSQPYAKSESNPAPPRWIDGAFVAATPFRAVVEILNTLKMMPKLNSGAEDVFYDMGSGPGHVVILAGLLMRIKAIGVERNSELAAVSGDLIKALRSKKHDLKEMAVRWGSIEDKDPALIKETNPFEDGTIFFVFRPNFGDSFNKMRDLLEMRAKEKEIRVVADVTSESEFDKKYFEVEKRIGGNIVILKSKLLKRSEMRSDALDNFKKFLTQMLNHHYDIARHLQKNSPVYRNLIMIVQSPLAHLVFSIEMTSEQKIAGLTALGDEFEALSDKIMELGAQSGAGQVYEEFLIELGEHIAKISALEPAKEIVQKPVEAKSSRNLIMVVDDDEILAELTAEILKLFVGDDNVKTFSGASAAAAATAELESNASSYFLVVTDKDMHPSGDKRPNTGEGMELIRFGKEYDPQLHFALISGLAADVSKDPLLEDVTVIEKGKSPTEGLQKAVEFAVKKRDAQSKSREQEKVPGEVARSEMRAEISGLQNFKLGLPEVGVLERSEARGISILITAVLAWGVFDFGSKNVHADTGAILQQIEAYAQIAAPAQIVSNEETVLKKMNLISRDSLGGTIEITDQTPDLESIAKALRFNTQARYAIVFRNQTVKAPDVPPDLLNRFVIVSANQATLANRVESAYTFVRGQARNQMVSQVTLTGRIELLRGLDWAGKAVNLLTYDDQLGTGTAFARYSMTVRASQMVATNNLNDVSLLLGKLASSTHELGLAGWQFISQELNRFAQELSVRFQADQQVSSAA